MGSKKTEVVKNLAVIMAGIFLVAVVVEAAWAPPTIAPPDGNVSAPINVSNTVQTKLGGLLVAGGVTAPVFTDGNNTNYYVDPESISYVNDLRANIMYDRNDTNYYVDPASTSRFNQVNLGGVTRSSWPVGESTPAEINDGISWSEVSDKPTFPTGGQWVSMCHCTTRPSMWAHADGNWTPVRADEPDPKGNHYEFSFSSMSRCINAGGTCDWSMDVWVSNVSGL